MQLTPTGNRRVYDGSIWSAIGKDGIFMAALAYERHGTITPSEGFGPLPVVFNCDVHQAFIAHDLTWTVSANGAASHVMLYMHGEHIMTSKMASERLLLAGDSLNIRSLHFPTWMDK